MIIRRPAATAVDGDHGTSNIASEADNWFADSSRAKHVECVMKTIFARLTLLLLAAVPCLAQSPTLQVLRLDRDGTLAWTNRLCPASPVYEILQAPAVTGPWQRVTLLTNQSSFALGPVAGDASGRAFYRLAWLNETPLTFSYAFDEGYGLPATVGTLNVALRPAAQMGVWSLQETDFVIEGRHPIGSGVLRAGNVGTTPQGQHRVRLYFTGPGGEGAVYLDGELQFGEGPGGCSYTSMSGTVHEVTFGGTEMIGTFSATRTP